MSFRKIAEKRSRDLDKAHNDQVKTKDNKKGKRFIFKDGKFSADQNLYDFDAAMVWSDAGIAFNAMKKGEEGIMEALQNHMVGIEGQIHSFTWFGAAINFVMQ